MITKSKMPFSSYAGVLLVAVTLIINSGYYLSTIKDSYFPLALLLFVTLLIVISTPSRKSIPVNFENISVLLLLFGICLSAMVNFSVANILSGARVAFTMMCSYIILIRIDTKKLLSTYSGLIRTIIIISAILYIFSNHVSLNFLPSISTTNGNYYNLLVVTQKISSSARVSGVFWEPGVFASHIVLSMLFDIYFLNPKVVNVLIYLLGIFITGSTAGILIMLLVLIGYILKKTRVSHKKYIEVLFFAMVIVALLFYDYMFLLLASINPKIFSKLIEIDSATSFTRINSPLVNLKLFLEKPFFGWGFTDAATQYLLSVDNKLVAQTSTSTQILSAIGILGIFYTLLCVIPLFSKKRLSNLSLIDKFIICVSILLIINKEPHIFFSITWLTLFLIARYSTKENEEAVSKSVQMQGE